MGIALLLYCAPPKLIGFYQPDAQGTSFSSLALRISVLLEAVLQRIGNTKNGFARIHAEEPDLVGEQCWQREEEMGIYPADFLLRRSRIGMWRPELLA